MPKMKTHSGAAKRFKKTGSGKFKRGHAKLRHILTSKDTKVKRKLAKQVMVDDTEVHKLKRMLPY
jgi:large subunit ribosomal protein L35